MAQRCQICKVQSSKYSCPSCLILYCSVPCYKDHKSKSCSNNELTTQPRPEQPTAPPEAESSRKIPSLDAAVPDAEPLRALTSLKWPYIPEETSFPDPLKRDDPKPLDIHQYQSIATSPDVRSALSGNSTLPELLRKLDRLRGPEREEALESLLGVANNQSTQRGPRKGVAFDSISKEDQKGLKQLAEAIEKAVRGEKPGVLGLDWAEDG